MAALLPSVVSRPLLKSAALALTYVFHVLMRSLPVFRRLNIRSKQAPWECFSFLNNSYFTGLLHQPLIGRAFLIEEGNMYGPLQLRDMHYIHCAVVNAHQMSG
jgi:hypothetical protein